MNTNFILNLIRKNFIVLLIIFGVFSFNFYNSFSNIQATHPKLKLVSKWDPVDNSLFYKVSLIGKSLIDEQYYLYKSINSVLSEDQNNNDKNNSFINPEIYFGIDMDNDTFLDESLAFVKPDSNISNLFRYFSQQNAKKFYYNHMQYNKKNIYPNLGFEFVDGQLSSLEESPYGIRIIFNSLTQDSNEANLAIEDIEEFMKISHQDFNRNQFAKISIFVESVLNSYQNILDNLTNTLLSEDKEKLLEIENYINYSIDQISKKKNALKEIYELSQFEIFKNSSNTIDSLQSELNIKILTNFVTNIFLFIFFSILYVYLKENIYSLINEKDN